MTINKTINDYVNRAQIAINDWQCSGELYYLAQAKAYVDVAETIAALVYLPDFDKKKSLPLYSVENYNDDLYDSPLEALEELDLKKIDKNETLELVEWHESEFRPHIDIEDLLDDFIRQTMQAGKQSKVIPII